MSGRIIIDDADHPAVEGGVYFIGYSEMVDGYRHAYEVIERGRTKVRYSRDRTHPADPRCPECHGDKSPEHPAGDALGVGGSGSTSAGRDSP